MDTTMILHTLKFFNTYQYCKLNSSINIVKIIFPAQMIFHLNKGSNIQFQYLNIDNRRFLDLKFDIVSPEKSIGSNTQESLTFSIILKMFMNSDIHRD